MIKKVQNKKMNEVKRTPLILEVGKVAASLPVLELIKKCNLCDRRKEKCSLMTNRNRKNPFVCSEIKDIIAESKRNDEKSVSQ